jgi:ornithine carbamoyltransferase
MIEESPLMADITTDTDVAVAAERMAGEDLCSISDLSSAEVRAVLKLAHDVKRRPEEYRWALDAKQMVLMFEKASLRTRLSFEAGINTLGGSAIFIDQTNSPLGERESLADTARNLERWASVLVLRTYAHDTITEIASYARIPVINALSDFEHPCQALADFMTLQEHFGSLPGLNFTYIGDGNNVCHSLMLMAAKLGVNCTIATPRGYSPDVEIVDLAKELSIENNCEFKLTQDPHAAVAGADAVYTDVCTSMGFEHESTKREPIFRAYQVNEALMAEANPRAVFMHCLPAKRNAEVTDAVMDGPQSIIFDQAENRMHAQKALLLLLLGAVRNTQSVRKGLNTSAY